MINLSYNISLNLKESLKEIESLRLLILLSNIPPKVELKIRWEAMVTRVFCSLKLAGNSLAKSQMETILANPPKKIEPEQKEVLRYKNSLEFISQNWLVSPQTVTIKTLVTLHDLYRPGKLRSSETALKDSLNYLQVNPEHPVVQSAIGLAQVTALSPFTNSNGIAARLLAYLLLYKYGYDFRRMLVFEKDWQKEPEVFRENLQRAIKNDNLTLFLEYFAQSVVNQLKELLHLLRTDPWQGKKPTTSTSELWNLNDRQKAILSYLEQPGVNITNRKVQKLSKVSQITASRDLAKLVKLGLVFSHGKGRSVYYTNV